MTGIRKIAEQPEGNIQVFLISLSFAFSPLQRQYGRIKL